jgi:lipoprotein
MKLNFSYIATMCIAAAMFGCAARQTGVEKDKFYYNSAEGLAQNISPSGSHINILYPNFDQNIAGSFVDALLSSVKIEYNTFAGKGNTDLKKITDGMSALEIPLPSNQQEMNRALMLETVDVQKQTFKSDYLVASSAINGATTMIKMTDVLHPRSYYFFYNKNEPLNSAEVLEATSYLPAFNPYQKQFVGAITSYIDIRNGLYIYEFSNYLNTSRFYFYSKTRLEGNTPYKLNVDGDKILSIYRVKDVLVDYIRQQAVNEEGFDGKNVFVDYRSINKSLTPFHVTMGSGGKQNRKFDIQYGDIKIKINIDDYDDDTNLVFGYQHINDGLDDRIKCLNNGNGICAPDYYVKDFKFDRVYTLTFMTLAYDGCRYGTNGASNTIRPLEVTTYNRFLKKEDVLEGIEKIDSCYWMIQPAETLNNFVLNFNSFQTARDSVENRKMGIYGLAVSQDKLYKTFLGILLKSKDTENNEKLLLNIAKIDPEVFKRIKLSQDKIAHKQNSILDVPDDADFVFCAENFEYLKNVNEYLDSRGEFKDLGFKMSKKVNYSKKVEYDTKNVKNVPSGEFGDFVDELNNIWFAIDKKYSDTLKAVIGEVKTGEKDPSTAFDYFKAQVKEKYYDYILGDAKYNAELNNAVQESVKKMGKYFEWEGFSKAEREYRSAMQKYGLGDIQPRQWCSEYFCPSRQKAMQIIKAKADQEWRIKVGGELRHGLTFWEFLQEPLVKREILQKIAPNIPQYKMSNFNYSYNDFADVINAQISDGLDEQINQKLKQAAIEQSQKASMKKYGITEIYYPNGWSDFVRSKPVQAELSKFYSGKRLSDVTMALEKKDLSGF